MIRWPGAGGQWGRKSAAPRYRQAKETKHGEKTVRGSPRPTVVDLAGRPDRPTRRGRLPRPSVRILHDFAQPLDQGPAQRPRDRPALAEDSLREPVSAPAPGAPSPRDPLSFTQGWTPSAVDNTPTHKPCRLPARLQSLAIEAVDRLAQVSCGTSHVGCQDRRQPGTWAKLAQSRRYFRAKESATETPTTYYRPRSRRHEHDSA